MTETPADPPGPEPIDPREIRRRLDRISDIFAGMVGHAERVSRVRCPYRDRLDRCTALFRCRNQRADSAGDDPEVLLCGHDGALDYRTAWETDARARRRVKDKIAAIRNEAAARRSAAREDEDEGEETL